MTTVDVSTKSWGGRLKESIKGILAGFFLLVATFPLLFWNEGRAVHRARVLEAGRGSVVSLEEPVVDPANQGRLVHLTGELRSNETVRDPQIGLEVDGVRLERNVEMYQWQEHDRQRTEKSASGSERTVTEYSYERVWSSRAIDSSRFREAGHYNPPMTLENATFDAVNVTVGDFRLSPALVSQVGGFQEIPALPQVAERANVGRPVHVAGTAYYAGRNPNVPEIGDMRVTFRFAPAGQQVSILGQQVGDTFSTWRNEGNTLEPVLRAGGEGVDAMFDSLETENESMTWAFRVLGFALMFGALMLMLKPMVVVAENVPLLGPVLKGGAWLVSGVLGFGFTLVTIAIGWISYRPLVGVPLLLAAIGTMGAFLYLKHGRGKPAPVAAPPAAPPPPSGPAPAA